MARLTFDKVARTLAAVRCLSAGQSFAEVAKSAGCHPSTIRRWVMKAGFRKVGNIYMITQ